LAMKHLVGIRAAALRPDRLWRVSLAAGGKAYESGIDDDSVVTFLKAHAQAPSNTAKQQSWMDDAAFGRQRSELIERLWARIRTLRDKATTGRRGQPYSSASARC